MREYKFRAWNKFFEEMYYFDFLNNIEVSKCGLWVKHKEGSVCVNQPSIILMQYIGLNDKNKNEIYDGDIVESKIHNPSRMIIEFIEGGYCATHPELESYPIDINHFYDSIGCMIEVIGNIYENPELLKTL